MISSSKEKHDWSAVGEGPGYVVKSHWLTRRTGWYMLELNLESAAPSGIAKFYFDSGDGMREEDTVSIGYRSGQLVKRLYLIRKKPVAIRFYPVDCAGDFTVHHFRIKRIPQFFAVNRMLKKLASNHRLFTGQKPAHIRKQLKTLPGNQGRPFAEILYETYCTLLEHKANPTEYLGWIEAIEKPALSSADVAQSAIDPFQDNPVISIVLPVYNSDPVLLERCIQSVARQSCPHWELCIADDASTHPAVRAVLDRYTARDARIKAVFRTENGHISAASNSALELCTGDYIAFLDHDDELAEHALLFVTQAIKDKPGAKILYSDEDKIDKAGRRHSPHMKPDWNPDLLLSQNYITHLTVIEAELVRHVGGLRTGVEGSQDHDLLLRCSREVQPTEVVHIPHVLYHWRTLPGSTAQAPESKDYTTAAGIRALTDHFTALDIPAGIEPGIVPNTYRVRYPLPAPPPRVSIIVPTRDKPDVLQICLDSLLERTDYPDFEVLVIDNQSTDPVALAYLDQIATHPRVRVMPYDYPFNYSAINNYAARHAEGEVLCLLNNDTEVITPDWLTEMVSHACRPEIGCVGAKLLYPDGSIQHAGVILGIGGVAGHAHKYAGRDEYGYFTRLHLVQNFSAVTAACLVVRKSIYQLVGGLNETDLPISFNDVDFCLRVREAGYRNLWTPHAELYHHESVSRGLDDSGEKARRAAREVKYMQMTWGELLYNDPAYNPNLSLLREDFSLKI